MKFWHRLNIFKDFSTEINVSVSLQVFHLTVGENLLVWNSLFYIEMYCLGCAEHCAVNVVR